MSILGLSEYSAWNRGGTQKLPAEGRNKRRDKGRERGEKKKVVFTTTTFSLYSHLRLLRDSQLVMKQTHILSSLFLGDSQRQGSVGGGEN